MAVAKFFPQIILGTAVSVTVMSGILRNDPQLVADHAASDTYFFSPAAPIDTPPSLHYPFPDDDGSNPFQNDENNFDLEPTQQPTIIYDSETNEYLIQNEIGGDFIENPQYITFEDYVNAQEDQAIDDYWKERSDASNILGGTGGKIELVPFDRECAIFDGCNVEIRPQGNVELTFGGSFQNIQNPILTESQRRQGGFDFDMDINANVLGSIGNNLKLNFNYNTQATFDFENQIKLEYKGKEDNIVQGIEAGNVSMPLTTQLIPGPTSLFGIKTELQFGRLTMTNILSQQKSQTQSIQIEGGAQKREFEIFADQYDENRHFFMSHYFRKGYEGWLKTLPYVSSPINVTKIEVWVTNTTGETQNTRDIVAFSDLGEPDSIYWGEIDPAGTVSSLTPGGLPSNNANNLYQKLYGTAGTRDLNTVISTLTGPAFNMQAVRDYEKARMRKLDPTDFIFNPQLGFISLNTTLQPDDVLAVAYEYTYNGQTYQVGEFSSDLPPGVDTSNVLFMKMLKSTSAITQIPLWDLMMKNVYSLGAFQVSSDGFRLDVVYQDPGGGMKRFIPANNSNVNSTPLIKLLGLDRLNNNNDPQPDGIFDFVNGVTINTQNGRVYFPVLEPFGGYLRSDAVFGNDLEAEKYAYDELYNETKTIALQFPQYDRYVLSGEYKSSVSSEIYLGAFNLPKGSVKVTAGGQLLTENVDYTIDYSLGRLKIVNEAILNSGQQINVTFENNAFYGFQTKSLVGSRLDYWINDNFTLGATWMHLSERPYTQKVNIGDDPISNSIYGFDINYTNDAPWLTRALDKLPFYGTKETSTISLTGEVARFQPGHSKAIGKDEAGRIYIDDFEGSRSAYDLKFPYSSWVLASTPQGATDENNAILFPEAGLFDSLTYGMNRAKLAWYNIDPLFNEQNNPSTPDHLSDADLSNHYTIQIDEKEIFPQADYETTVLTQLSTFDLAYYPTERGPYNFDLGGTPFSAGVENDGSGKLREPETRWGGLMRNLETNDFEAANIEFIEFWVMDPFDNRGPFGTQVTSDGYLYINLGNVSEDVLKDSRMFFENGLPKDGSTDALDQTNWGNVPRTPPITTAFDNDVESRANQDKGYDGLNSDEEADFYNQFMLDAPTYVSGAALVKLESDPSTDDYHYYRGGDYDDAELSILERYKKYNNPQGNSPTTESSPEAYPTAATTIPESEDLNDDYTLNETESYFQYRIKLEPGMESINPYITDVVVAEHTFQDGSSDSIKWYQFKVPIDQFDGKVGSIQDFKSIRFMRMFMTGFTDDVVLRFARLELVRNQWRRYQFSMLNPGEYIGNDDGNETDFNVSSVSIEENSARQPIPYALPPGISREQTLGSGSSVSTYQQNEQSLSMQICPLQDGDARAIFKSLNIDLRRYGRLTMNVHAEPLPDAPLTTLNDGDLHIFIRLGSDFTNNYYEYDLPLTVTKLPLPAGTTEDEAVREAIWATLIDFPLDSLVQVKTLRNKNEVSPLVPFSITSGTDQGTYTIIGNPDLGYVEEIMIGVRNPKDIGGSGAEFCSEVWVNELRLSNIDESGGWAALARADVKLADLGNFTLSGNLHTAGFGTLEQQIDERYKDNFYQYAASLSLELGKFLPQGVNLRLPLYASISESFSNPEFDPYELDVDLQQKLDEISTTYGADSSDLYKRSVIDYIAVKSINLSNIRFERGDKAGDPHLWDKENFDLTLAYSQEYNSNPILEYDIVDRYKAALGYSYSQKAKYILPFEKVIDKKYKWLTPVRDFNFNLLPTGYSFRTELNRQYGETLMRDVYGDGLIDPTYDKYFTWDRFYGLKLEPAKSIKIDFSATNNARIDEPYGALDTKEKRDSLWNSFYDFGRNINYRHTVSATYTLPISKLPIFSWITIKANYNTSYGWVAGSIGIADTLGNTINNTQSKSVNGEFNFRNLYNKSKFLKQYNSNTSPKAEKKSGKGDEEATDEKAADENTKTAKKPSTPTVSPPVETLVRLLISLKRMTVNYSQNYATTLPGFMPSTDILGLNAATTAPGWDFIFGYQPSYKWMDSIARKGWISSATSLNYLFLQTYSENLDVRANFEPLKDFRLDLNLNKTYSKNHSEYFKNTNSIDDPLFSHLNGVDAGSFNISYSIMGTVFEKLDAKEVSATFKQFEANREIISARWAALNTIYADDIFFNPLDGTFLPNYTEGYGPYSQDVLIPAFLAAYTGKDANEVSLNPFDQMPKPNYRITYNGLSKLPGFKRLFSSFNVTSAYTSTLALNSFITDLDFDGNYFAYGHVVDTLTGNYVTLYDIPNIIVNEALSPLIGFDVTWINGVTSKFDFKKSRTLTMSFIDYQLTQINSTEFTIGAGYKMSGFTFPFKIRGKRPNLENDLTFKFDFSFRDDITTNFRLDQDLNEPTGGMKSISLSPTIDYVVNDRFNVQLYFDRQQTIPKISTSYPITSTNAGVKVRFSLAE